MRTFIIGRSRYSDIVLIDQSISPRHAELVITDDGRHHLTDCWSDLGLWRIRIDQTTFKEINNGSLSTHGNWQRFRQAFVHPNEPVRIGNYDCTTTSLLSQIVESVGLDQWDGRWRAHAAPRDNTALVRGAVERDPVTGEIIRRRLRA